MPCGYFWLAIAGHRSSYLASQLIQLCRRGQQKAEQLKEARKHGRSVEERVLIRADSKQLPPWYSEFMVSCRTS